jgi:hypothetical protein
VNRIAALVLSSLLAVAAAMADEVPISGAVKSVDTTAQTVTIETTAKGKTREVMVYLKPGAKVVKFARATEPGATGFVEQTVGLAELKPGWLVSIATRHEGGKEVADLVTVVLER